MIDYGQLIIIHEENEGLIEPRPVAIVVGLEAITFDVIRILKKDDDYKGDSFTIASMPIFKSLKEAEDYYQCSL